MQSLFRQIVLSLLPLLLLVSPPAAYAQPNFELGKVLFGPELEFSREGFRVEKEVGGAASGFPKARKVASELVSAMKARCDEFNCKLEYVKGKWGQEARFRLAGFDGYLQVSWDPGCVEVLMSPKTVPEMRAWEHLIEDFLYRTAASVNLQPSQLYGGHINIGAESAFANDPELFLRFFVDQANNPELVLGGIGRNILNAPPLSILKPQQREQLQAIIREFNAGEYQTYEEIAEQIQKRVYTWTIEYNTLSGAGHYQAVSVKSISGARGAVGLFKSRANKLSQRVELRGVHGQVSYNQFVTLADFLERRIGYLHNQHQTPIVYTAPVTADFIPDQAAVDHFHKYAKEAGMNPRDYKILQTQRVQDWIPSSEFVCKDVLKNAIARAK